MKRRSPRVYMRLRQRLRYAQRLLTELTADIEGERNASARLVRQLTEKLDNERRRADDALALGRQTRDRVLQLEKELGRAPIHRKPQNEA